MDEVMALRLTAVLLGVLAVIQSSEFLLIARATSDRGVWRWPDLQKELGSIFAPALGGRAFIILNFVRLIAGLTALVAPNAVLIAILLACHVLTLLRWLGTFNGGSDYMNLLLLWTTTLGLLAPEAVAKFCLWYVTFQLVLSYFKAGWVKVKTATWRSGRALPGFLGAYAYERSNLTAWLQGSKAKLASWAVMLFELSFPLALVDKRVALAYMAVGACFHLGNAYFFGLNRFFWAWIAAYPALYYCSRG